jgi:hypothetical protein
VTSRLHTAIASPDWGRYDTLVQEAFLAFEQDVMYAIQVVESARSISDKKRNAKKTKSKLRGECAI